MEHLFVVLSKIFNAIFVGNNSIARAIGIYWSRNSLLIWGFIFLIIGFAVGLLKRIIHST